MMARRIIMMGQVLGYDEVTFLAGCAAVNRWPEFIEALFPFQEYAVSRRGIRRSLYQRQVQEQYTSGER